MRTYRIWGNVGILLGLSAAFTSAGVAYAQGPAQPDKGAPAASATAPSTAPPMPPDYVPASTTPVSVPTELLKPTAGGITAEQTAKRAAQTSYQAKAADENLRGAAARVDAAWAAFLPRLSGTASYTRLSNFTPPSFGSGSFVGVNEGAGPIAAGTPLFGVDFSIPLVLNQWLFQARVVVPISDYFLKINQNYESATRSQDAYRFDALTARAVSWANGKIAYYTWLRARGGIVVADEALNDQRTHLKDAQNQFAVGNASRADVLRAETAVSSAELAVERAKNLADLTEKQVRVAMHATDEESLAPGESLDSPLPAFDGNVKQMTVEAESSRYEIKSADANADSARKAVAAQKSGRYPVLSAFGDGIEGNPNPRRFPATQDWFGTWDVGAQLTWSPNDLLVANANVSDFETRAAAIEAQRGVTRDGIDVEVLQNFQGVREADFAIDSSKREVASATEAYRVARELFNNGRGTSTTLTDAESELTRSRLDLLNAYADARIARVRLDHSLGRDTRQLAGGQ
jgi:outer membrane protein TolC